MVDVTKVRGFPLKSYLPKNNTKEELRRWTFDCAEWFNQDSAVAGQKAAMKKTANMYPAANFDFGAASWNWPDMAICSQKLINQDKFDPTYGYFAWFSSVRRAEQGEAGRDESVAAKRRQQRGWPRSRIEAAKKRPDGSKPR